MLGKQEQISYRCLIQTTPVGRGREAQSIFLQWVAMRMFEDQTTIQYFVAKLVPVASI